MEYKIVNESGKYAYEVCDRLQKEVQTLCHNGWKPQGGVSLVVSQYGTFTACQAMIKLKEDEKEKEQCVVRFTEL